MDWFAHRARTDPDTLALIDGDTGDEWTYAEFSGSVDRVATRLGAYDIEPESTVGTLLPRSPEHLQTIWAIRRLGATVVPMDPSEPPERTRQFAEMADLDLVVVEADPGSDRPDLGAVSTASVTEIQIQPSREGRTREANSPQSVAATRLDETMVVLFTSGTTGDPKGVRLTARNIGASAAGSAFRLGVEPGDRWLLTLPVHHMGGLSIPFRAAIYGTTVVIERDFQAHSTRQTMTRNGVTGVSMVPTMLRRLLDEGPLPDSLRFVLVGGAPTPTTLVDRALDTGVPLNATYGMTETASQVATAMPAELRADPETVGRPIRTATVRIVDEQGRQQATGETGEITVSGPIVSPGYLADSTERDPGAAFATGDVGYLDEADRLFVTGRMSDMIITGGENVHPSEVRDALLGLSDVDDAAVVGIPDQEWGERVVAMVVRRGNRSGEAFRKELRGRLVEYKVPRSVQVVDAIPRTKSGTVDRRSVRDAFGE